MSANSLGSHSNPEEECCWFRLIGQSGEAESKNKGHMAHQWYCWDFNPRLLKSQVHIHFLSSIESLIQILAFTCKEVAEFGKDMEGKKQEPMTIGREIDSKVALSLLWESRNSSCFLTDSCGVDGGQMRM